MRRRDFWVDVLVVVVVVDLGDGVLVGAVFVGSALAAGHAGDVAILVSKLAYFKVLS